MKCHICNSDLISVQPSKYYSDWSFYCKNHIYLSTENNEIMSYNIREFLTRPELIVASGSTGTVVLGGYHHSEILLDLKKFFPLTMDHNKVLQADKLLSKLLLYISLS